MGALLLRGREERGRGRGGEGERRKRKGRGREGGRELPRAPRMLGPALYGPVLYRFRDKTRYWLKIAIFHTIPGLWVV